MLRLCLWLFVLINKLKDLGHGAILVRTIHGKTTYVPKESPLKTKRLSESTTVVVAIILIIAAWQFPLLRRAIAANEAATWAHCAHHTSTSPSNHLPDLASKRLAHGSGQQPVSSTSAGLIDATLSAGTKSGYSFATSTTLNVRTITITTVGCTPSTPGRPAAFFCSDQSGP